MSNFETVSDEKIMEIYIQKFYNNKSILLIYYRGEYELFANIISIAKELGIENIDDSMLICNDYCIIEGETNKLNTIINSHHNEHPYMQVFENGECINENT